ncbi:hypothetical protein BGW80DRAFT_1275918 [Lactifluus volemus]|nr:hypothetical protein BGW80DRAFT_1275918 [Lactifluus volemus]
MIGESKEARLQLFRFLPLPVVPIIAPKVHNCPRHHRPHLAASHLNRAHNHASVSCHPRRK